MSELERKYGKYAIKNLSLKLTMLYGVGFILLMMSSLSGNSSLYSLISLNPFRIIFGLQIWRLISWVLMPISSTNVLFVLITLYFYFWIGTIMEQTWGEFRYNLYIFSGMLLTIISAFLVAGIYLLSGVNGVDNFMTYAFTDTAMSSLDYQFMAFSMYYVNISVLLAYAATYPDNMVLFMFIIPVKMKVFGFITAGFMIYEIAAAAINGSISTVLVIAPALVNFALFWMLSKRRIKNKNPFVEFNRQNSAKKMRPTSSRTQYVKSTVVGSSPLGTRHKCTICGQTERDNPNLEFRYCSKCGGKYEYCSEHLFTHVHKDVSNG